jgi:hypothetical protein
MAPGPEVAMQTPTSPVNLACAVAMNEACSHVYNHIEKAGGTPVRAQKDIEVRALR